MKARYDCEIACDCVKRANVDLHVGLCKEIFARKHTATHKPTSAQPLYSYQRDIHTRIYRLWSPLAYGLGGNKPYLRKSTDRKAQIRKAFVQFSGLICALGSIDFLRYIYHPEPPHAQSLFLFPIVFGINHTSNRGLGHLDPFSHCFK